MLFGGQDLFLNRLLCGGERIKEIAQGREVGFEHGDFTAALRLAQDLLVLEPHEEAHHTALMRMHYLRGEPAAGLAAWSSDAAARPVLIVRGQANLIENATATADLERIRKLFEDIENKKELAQLLGAAEQGEGVRIFIGSENRLFSLSGSSIIVTPFRNAEEKIVGVMGIIGPTRMNYARIIPMVDYTAKAIGRLLT